MRPLSPIFPCPSICCAPHVPCPTQADDTDNDVLRSYDEYGCFAAETVRVDLITQSACWAAHLPDVAAADVLRTPAVSPVLQWYAQWQMPPDAGCLRDLKEEMLLVWRAEGEDWEPSPESDDEDVDNALATIDMRELGAISREAEARLGCSVEEAALQVCLRCACIWGLRRSTVDAHLCF